MNWPIPAGSIVVSAQARTDNPLHGSAFMAAMARAAAEGGASAIRANGPADIAAIKVAVRLPVIGLLKRKTAGYPVEITPSLSDAQLVATAGADIVAIDATNRARDGQALDQLLPAVRRLRPVLADIADLPQGLAAAALGASAVATTLSGYTAETQTTRDAPPDLELVAALARTLTIPVLAEGRFWTLEQVHAAFAAGAHAVVIGTAITNPREITRRFVGSLA